MRLIRHFKHISLISLSLLFFALLTFPLPSRAEPLYNINHSVSFKASIDFSLTQETSQSDYWIAHSRFKTHKYQVSSVDSALPYMKAVLESNELQGTFNQTIYNDQFGNEYDLFQAQLLPSSKIELAQEYTLTTYDLEYNLDEFQPQEYDTSDPIFALYCNHSETYFNTEDPKLVVASNGIVESSDCPVVKAEKIYRSIASTLEYEEQDREIGASRAFIQKKGDCSEYSDLMITLLRIQGIPARKVCGMIITKNDNADLYTGKTWIFEMSEGQVSDSDFMFHAWVEYYVAGMGWIPCDPTLYESGDYYFNRVDSFRLPMSIGAWMTLPLPLGCQSINEFINPLVCSNGQGELNLFYRISVEFLGLDRDIFTLQPFLALILSLLVFGTVGICILIFYLIKIKSRPRAPKHRDILPIQENKQNMKKRIEDHKFCECGARIRVMSKYCLKCGKKFEK